MRDREYKQHESDRVRECERQREYKQYESDRVRERERERESVSNGIEME